MKTIYLVALLIFCSVIVSISFFYPKILLLTLGTFAAVDGILSFYGPYLLWKIKIRNQMGGGQTDIREKTIKYQKFFAILEIIFGIFILFITSQIKTN